MKKQPNYVIRDSKLIHRPTGCAVALEDTYTPDDLRRAQSLLQRIVEERR